LNPLSIGATLQRGWTIQPITRPRARSRLYGAPEVKRKRRKPTVPKSTTAEAEVGKYQSGEGAAEPGLVAVRETRRRIADPQKMPKNVKKLPTPERRGTKTEAEKVSDELARESMRSYKPSSWRLGRSPGGYG
jgi:hypothetical protein